MTGVEIAVLCLLARRYEAMYPSSLVRRSNGILTRPSVYVLLSRLCKQGLVEKCVGDIYDVNRPAYKITAVGMSKILKFTDALGVKFA